MSSQMVALYHCLPARARSAVASMRGWYLNRWRFSKETVRLVDETLDRDTWIPTQWDAWRAERLIAHRLQTLIRERPPWPVIDPERAIGWVEKKFGVSLAASQRAAVALALANKLLVVTGGPGVGKTTLVNSILKILCAKSVAVAR